MPPERHRRRAWPARSPAHQRRRCAASIRSRNSSADARRELGRAAEPAPFRVERLPHRATAAVELRLRRLSVARGQLRRSRSARPCARAGSFTSVGLLAVGMRHRLQHLAEGGHAHPRLRREVGAAVERLAVGRQEHGHRPAAVPGSELDDGVHVDGVEVGPLLAVDLDVHEQPVHQLRGLGVLERLVRHHVAPVAGGVADREQDRPVLPPRPLQRLLAPRVPVHRVVGVLQQVGAGLDPASLFDATTWRIWCTSPSPPRHRRPGRRRCFPPAPSGARRDPSAPPGTSPSAVSMPAAPAPSITCATIWRRSSRRSSSCERHAMRCQRVVAGCRETRCSTAFRYSRSPTRKKAWATSGIVRPVSRATAITSGP